MSITLEIPFITTETKTYTSFIVLAITIAFGESAKISIQLNQDGLGTLNKIIEVPVETYEGWSFNQTQITEFIKLQLQN